MTLETAKLNLRLPVELRDQIADLAKSQDRSINSLIVQLLRKELTWKASPKAQANRASSPAPVARLINNWPKVGRNEYCPCGSLKKAKVCHPESCR